MQTTNHPALAELHHELAQQAALAAPSQDMRPPLTHDEFCALMNERERDLTAQLSFWKTIARVLFFLLAAICLRWLLF